MSVALEQEQAAPKQRRYFGNPWRKPRFLQLTTIGYLLWSLLPVVIAIFFSFNSGRSRIIWQGFSLRWWTQDPTDSLLHDPAMRQAMLQTYKLSIATVIIAVPLGTLFAIGVDRWHGRPARSANFVMLLSFVVPEIILGVSLYILFTALFHDVIPLGTKAQLLGLIAYQISYPVIIVRARLLSIGPEYEEAAMDLGATPNQSTAASTATPMTGHRGRAVAISGCRTGETSSSRALDSGSMERSALRTLTSTPVNSVGMALRDGVGASSWALGNGRSDASVATATGATTSPISSLNSAVVSSTTSAEIRFSPR